MRLSTTEIVKKTLNFSNRFSWLSAYDISLGKLGKNSIFKWFKKVGVYDGIYEWGLMWTWLQFNWQFKFDFENVLIWIKLAFIVEIEFEFLRMVLMI